jgi:glutamyl-tRNA synthetase
VIPFLENAEIIWKGQEIDRKWLSKAIKTLQERAKTLVELANSLRYYIAEDVQYDEKAKAKFLIEKSTPYLRELKEAIESLSDFSVLELEKVFKTITKKHNVKLGALAQPVRVAMTGGTESPGIFEVLEVLGKEKAIKRLEKAIKSI